MGMPALELAVRAKNHGVSEWRRGGRRRRSPPPCDKQLFAAQLHRKSGKTGPFVAVSCAAIADNLIESELFGHVSGAFTGARGDRPGAFQAAHGGTLFLDELGDAPPSLHRAPGGG